MDCVALKEGTAIIMEQVFVIKVTSDILIIRERNDASDTQIPIRKNCQELGQGVGHW